MLAEEELSLINFALLLQVYHLVFLFLIINSEMIRTSFLCLFKILLTFLYRRGCRLLFFLLLYLGNFLFIPTFIFDLS